MRRCVLTILLFLTAAAYSQRHSLSIHVPIGMTTDRTDSRMSIRPGWSTGFGFRYGFLFMRDASVGFGMQLGAEATLGTSSWALHDYREQYINIDYYPEEVHYTVSAVGDIVQRQFWGQVGLPLYFVIHMNGWHINVGPSVCLPIFGTRRQDLTAADILAYYPIVDVTVPNRLVTGLASSTVLHQQESHRMFTVDTRLNVELGYEWQVSPRTQIGADVFMNVSVWNNYQNSPSQHRLIDVDPILNTSYPVPDVKIHYLTDTYVSSYRPINFGVKLYVAFSSNTTSCRLRRNFPCRCVVN